MTPDTARGCVRAIGTKFGNDQNFVGERFDEVNRWNGWSKNEFSQPRAGANDDEDECDGCMRVNLQDSFAPDIALTATVTASTVEG